MNKLKKQIKFKLDRYFKISEHNTTIRTEIYSGLTAYFTMVYLLFLVPETIILALPNAVNSSGELMLDNYVLLNYTTIEVLTSLTLASCIAAGIGSIFIGLSTNLPFAQGPSLAITTFISYTVIQQFGYTYYQALALTFISGVLFLFLNVLGMEERIENAIPTNLKHAVTVGIGLFIACIGFKKAYIVRPDSGNVIALLDFSNTNDYYTKTAMLALFGVILIAILLKKHVHGAILIGKILCIIIAIPLGLTNKTASNLTYNLTLEPVFLKLDFHGLINNDLFEGVQMSLLVVTLVVISICVIEVFETAGVVIATDVYLTVNEEESVEDNHNRLSRIFDVNAITTFIGSLFGSTTVSTYVENTASIVEGGRTGLTAIITGLLFLLTAFISPTVHLIPSAATATTLIITGMLMMSVMKYIDFDDPVEALPAFLTMILMPLTNSMIIGITVGMLSSVLIKIFTGRIKEIAPLSFAIVAVFTILFYIS